MRLRWGHDSQDDDLEMGLIQGCFTTHRGADIVRPVLVLGKCAVGPAEGADVGIEDQIVNVNEYDLVASADEFVAAIEALAHKTDAEGESGVLRYQFYVNRNEGSAVATIVYRDADAWLEHHRLAYTWPEMAKLQATVKLRRLTFLGPLNDEIEAMASGIDVPIVRCDTLAAGFTRTP